MAEEKQIADIRINSYLVSGSKGYKIKLAWTINPKLRKYHTLGYLIQLIEAALIKLKTDCKVVKGKKGYILKICKEEKKKNGRI